MMRCSPFKYVAAKSLADVTAALATEGPRARLVAGGTDLVPNMKRRQQTPAVVVGLRRVRELQTIAEGGAGALAIGAGVTLTDVKTDARVRQGYNALFRAAAQVATPPIQNMGTLGGNLCLDTRCNYYNQNYEWRQAIDFCKKAPGPAATHVLKVVNEDDGTCWVAPGSPRCWAVSSSDTAPALIALGARITLASKAGEREIPLEDLYRDDGMDHLSKRADEVLTRVALPAATPDGRSTYWKLRRRDSFDFPVLGVGAWLRLGKGNVVEAARVVLGGVASRPVLVPETAGLLGKPLDDAAIDAFAEQASLHAKPLDNTDFVMGWRKRVSKTYLAGVLRELRGDDPASFGLTARHAMRVLPVVG